MLVESILGEYAGAGSMELWVKGGLGLGKVRGGPKKEMYIYIYIHTVLDLPGIKLYTINHMFLQKKDTFFRVLNVLHFQTNPFLVVSDLLISEFLWGTEDLCGGGGCCKTSGSLGEWAFAGKTGVEREIFSWIVRMFRSTTVKVAVVWMFRSCSHPKVCLLLRKHDDKTSNFLGFLLKNQTTPKNV